MVSVAKKSFPVERWGLHLSLSVRANRFSKGGGIGSSLRSMTSLALSSWLGFKYKERFPFVEWVSSSIRVLLVPSKVWKPLLHFKVMVPFWLLLRFISIIAGLECCLFLSFGSFHDAFWNNEASPQEGGFQDYCPYKMFVWLWILFSSVFYLFKRLDH